MASTQAPGKVENHPGLLIGSPGHLTVFLWSLAVILVAPQEMGVFPILACMLLLSGLYPSAFRRLLQPRWLGLLSVLFLINLIFGVGEPDRLIWGLPVSMVRLTDGLLMTFRAIVILVAAEGLSASVGITEVAGLFERLGLRGLGFSLGVAANLLPTLRQSSTNAWHSLWMRGGFRAQRWRGLQLLTLTVFGNALRRSEEIVLAAEARAFRPERSRTLPLRSGKLDRWLILAASITLAALILIPS
jgi:energy-coupling factor transporter transmembrane protein EcfT